MAVMEHAYYASFGYQVTSFFAASRYGRLSLRMGKQLLNRCEDGSVIFEDVANRIITYCQDLFLKNWVKMNNFGIFKGKQPFLITTI